MNNISCLVTFRVIAVSSDSLLISYAADQYHSMLQVRLSHLKFVVVIGGFSQKFIKKKSDDFVCF